jgi:hypothetical protein
MQRSKYRAYQKLLAPKFRIVAAKMRRLIDCCFLGLSGVINTIFE